MMKVMTSYEHSKEKRCSVFYLPSRALGDLLGLPFVGGGVRVSCLG